MRWSSHRLISFSITFLTFGEILFAFIAIWFANIPDLVEGTNFQSKAWRKNHRRNSHAIDIYLVLLIVSLLSCYVINNSSWCFLSANCSISFQFLLCLIFLVVAIAAYSSLLHIIADFLSAKITISMFSKKRIALQDYVKFSIPVGSLAEHLITTSAFSLTMSYILYSYLTSKHFTISPFLNNLLPLLKHIKYNI